MDVSPDAGFTVALDQPEGSDWIVATITLNRPDVLNAQHPAMWRELARVGSQLPGTVRVVVVRGAGRAFSAGLDRSLFSPSGVQSGEGLMAIAHSSAEQASATIAEFQSAFGWLSRPDLVSVAVVQGHAIGGGFQLALACDLRLVVSDAQFAMAEPSLGLVPDLGGTKRLVELVGYSRAASICLTARRVDAREADRIGLASLVVDPSNVEAALAETISGLLSVSRDAQVETKALLLAASGRSQGEQEQAEREAQYRRLRDLAFLFSEAQP